MVSIIAQLERTKYRPDSAVCCAGMLGNVWEWVSGRAEGDGRRPKKGKMSAKEKEELANQRVLRGGSFVDTADGSHNHMISVCVGESCVYMCLHHACVAIMLLIRHSLSCTHTTELKSVQVSTRQENSADSGANNVGKWDI